MGESILLLIAVLAVRLPVAYVTRTANEALFDWLILVISSSVFSWEAEIGLRTRWQIQ